MSVFQYINFVIGLFVFQFFLYACFISFKEKQNQAAIKFILTGLISFGLLLIISLLKFDHVVIINIITLNILSIFFILILFPTSLFVNNKEEIVYPKIRIDERNTMFSRNKLVPGSDLFDEYYKNNPKHLIKDSKFRQEPGLLQKGSLYYNPVLFSSANSSFHVVDSLKPIVDGKAAESKTDVNKEKISHYIKSWAKKLGALDVGICLLKNYHLYSYGGRDERYNMKIETSHKYAIAFTVEMDHTMTAAGPKASIVMESAQQYLNSGIIATQIATFIRNLGYSARAHIDGNYQVVCPLVAKDAGLGEIGRMGLLMSPKHGPRVRINVITTDLEIETDIATNDATVTYFCSHCKKCARCCPSQAIPFNQQQIINGVKRWQINQEDCFTFWCKTGTDCGRCIAVCPYSHPDNLLHNFIRWGIRNNKLFSRMALLLDDFYYGKKPSPGKLPEWCRI